MKGLRILAPIDIRPLPSGRATYGSAVSDVWWRYIAPYHPEQTFISVRTPEPLPALFLESTATAALCHQNLLPMPISNSFG